MVEDASANIALGIHAVHPRNTPVEPSPAPAPAYAPALWGRQTLAVEHNRALIGRLQPRRHP